MGNIKELRERFQGAAPLHPDFGRQPGKVCWLLGWVPASPQRHHANKQRDGAAAIDFSFSSALPPPSQKSPPLELQMSDTPPSPGEQLSFPSCTSLVQRRGKHVGRRWGNDGSGKPGDTAGRAALLMAQIGPRGSISSHALLN